MSNLEFVSNKILSEYAKKKIETAISENEEYLFSVVSDLKPDGNYGEGIVTFTDKRFFVFSDDNGDDLSVFFYGDISSPKVKRMYGKTKFTLVAGNVEKTVVCSTNSNAMLCDVICYFVGRVNENPDTLREQFEIVKEAIEKQNNRCPKCSRKLIHPGAPCIHCESKTHIIKKLSKYVKPHMLPLIVCGDGTASPIFYKDAC